MGFMYIEMNKKQQRKKFSYSNPNAISYPLFSSPSTALIVAATSGAPFPKASSVTPGKLLEFDQFVHMQ